MVHPLLPVGEKVVDGLGGKLPGIGLQGLEVVEPVPPHSMLLPSKYWAQFSAHWRTWAGEEWITQVEML